MGGWGEKRANNYKNRAENLKVEQTRLREEWTCSHPRKEGLKEVVERGTPQGTNKRHEGYEKVWEAAA